MDIYAHMAKWGDLVPDMVAHPYRPDEWSLLALRLRNPDEDVSINVNAGRGLLPHLLTKTNETGFLTVWNDAETIAIPKDRIVAIKMTTLTKEGK